MSSGLERHVSTPSAVLDKDQMKSLDTLCERTGRLDDLDERTKRLEVSQQRLEASCSRIEALLLSLVGEQEIRVTSSAPALQPLSVPEASFDETEIHSPTGRGAPSRSITFRSEMSSV